MSLISFLISNFSLDYLKKNFHYRVFKEQNLSYLIPEIPQN